VRYLLYGEGYTIRGVQRILREQGAAFVQNVWRADAEPPPPQLEEDREATGEAGAGTLPEPNLFALSPPGNREGADYPDGRREPTLKPAAAEEPSTRRPAALDHRRKLQAALDDLVACRRLIEDAFARD